MNSYFNVEIMRRLSVFLAAIGIAILTFDHLARIQHWVIDSGKIVENGGQVPLDSMNGLPVLSFILLALAAFLGGIYYKKNVFTWAGVTFLVVVIGYLFNIMQWPGANLVLAISFGFFIIIIIPWFTAFLMIGPDKKEKEIVDDKLNVGVDVKTEEKDIDIDQMNF